MSETLIETDWEKLCRLDDQVNTLANLLADIATQQLEGFKILLDYKIRLEALEKKE